MKLPNLRNQETTLDHKNQRDVLGFLKDRCILRIEAGAYGNVKFTKPQESTRDSWEHQIVEDMRRGTLWNKTRGTKHQIGKMVEERIMGFDFESPNQFENAFEYLKRLKARFDGMEINFCLEGEKVQPSGDPYERKTFMARGDQKLPADEPDLDVTVFLEWL